MEPAKQPTTRIDSLLNRASRRYRTHRALQGSSIALLVAAVIATVVGLLLYQCGISVKAAAISWLACGAVVVATALFFWSQKPPKHVLAAAIDKASGLSSRISSAYEFTRDKRQGFLIQEAITDAHRHAEKADVAAATPIPFPKLLVPALVITAISVGVGYLGVVVPPEVNAVFHKDGKILSSKTFVLNGEKFRRSGETTKLSLTQVAVGRTGRDEDGEPMIAWEKTSGTTTSSQVSTPAMRSLSAMAPSVASPAKFELVVIRGARKSEPFTFEVWTSKAKKFIENPDRLDLRDLEDIENQNRDLLQSIDPDDEDLKQLVQKTQELIEKAKQGLVTKREFQQALAKLQNDYMQRSTDKHNDVKKTMKSLAQSLAKNKATKSLGKALQNGDQKKAQEEFEKLAKKLESGTMSEKEEQELAKALEKASDAIKKSQDNEQEQQTKKQQRLQNEIDELNKKANNETDKDKKKEMSDKAEKKKRELKQLKRDEEKKQKSESRRQLKKLQRNLREAAQTIKKQKNVPPAQKQASRKQAAKLMRGAKKNSGAIDRDQRKLRNKQKSQSRMKDMKEAARRMRKKARNKQRSKFGKNKSKKGKGKGQGQGQGQGQGGQGPGQGGNGQGQGQGQGQGGQGPGQGGNGQGDGTDGNFTGDLTKKRDGVTDDGVTGEVTGDGVSVKETITSAAQKGFSGTGYKRVYKNYKHHAEEVMQKEKIPTGYRHYIRKYYSRIRHQGEAP